MSWIGVLLVALLGTLAGGSVALHGESAPTPTALALRTFDDGASAIAVDIATGGAAPARMSCSRIAAPISFR